jgi:hypothetical protein
MNAVLMAGVVEHHTLAVNIVTVRSTLLVDIIVLFLWFEVPPPTLMKLN